MTFVLYALIAVNSLAFIATATLGILLESPESMRLHFACGLMTAILIVFSHLLVMFYLIGTEGDIKEALGERPDLLPAWVPKVKALKWRSYPAIGAAVLLTILAALLGGEVHSRILLEAAVDVNPPVREVPFWWIHLLFVGLALTANVIAFVRALEVARENRRIIDQLNDILVPSEPVAPASSEAP